MTGSGSSRGLVVFSHGKDSGPGATKISALRPLAAEHGWRTLSVDYSSTNDTSERLELLLETLERESGPLVLMGSSLGGLVSVFGAQKLEVSGLFLLAPAVYWPGYEHLDYSCPAPVVEVVHGWRDDVVPVESSIRLAREQGASLHVLDDDHRLIDRLADIELLFVSFLHRVQAVLAG